MHDAFRELVSDRSQRGLVITISSEALVLKHTLLANGTFEADLMQLDDVLTPVEPAYIILRRYEGSAKPPFIAITYVPDAANVRQKMLFASTRNTLLRELGTDRFGESIFATLKEELTVKGFERHDAHGAKYSSRKFLLEKDYIDLLYAQTSSTNRRRTLTQGSPRP